MSVLAPRTMIRPNKPMKTFKVQPMSKYPFPEVEEEEEDEDCCCCNCSNIRHNLLIFLVFFLYAFAVHVFCNALVLSIHYESFAMMFEKMGWVVRAVVAAVTTHRSLKPEPHEQENELLKKTRVKVFEEPQRVFVKSVVISWCVTITFWLLKTGIMTWFFSTRNVQSYFSHSFYALNIKVLGISEGAAAAIAVINWTINNCASLLGGLHLTELIWQCYNLQKGLEQMEQYAYNYGVRLRSIRSSDLRETHMMYLKVRNNLHEAEDRFSFPILLWLLEIVIGIICCICSVHAVMKDNDLAIVAEETVEIIYYMIIFGIMCYEVSEINCKSQFFNVTLGEMAAYVSMDDRKISTQFFLLESTVNTTQFSLTAWKFFPLDRPSSLVIIGVVVAYSVILLHLSEEMSQSSDDSAGSSAHH